MNDRILEILLGHILEAIYFALFMIFTKQIKTKKWLFIICTILEYVLMFNAIRYSIWSHLLFFISIYLLQKVLYRDEAMIIDIFTLGIASLLILIVSVPLYFVVSAFTIKYLVYVICTRIGIFSVLFAIKNKLLKIQKLYLKLWNRNDKVPKKIKSTTFRALNTVVFNFMFCALNVCVMFALYKW